MCESFESDCLPMAAWRSCHAAALVRLRVRSRARVRAGARVTGYCRARDGARVGIRVRARIRLAINPDPNPDASPGPNLRPRKADEDPILWRDGLVDGAPRVRVRVGVMVGARDKS